MYGSNLPEETIHSVVIIRVIVSSISLFGAIILIFMYSVLCIKTRCKKKEINLLSIITNQKNLQSSETLTEEFINNNDMSLNQYNSRTKSPKKKLKYKIGIGNDLLLGFSLSQVIYSISAFVKTSNFSATNITSDCVAQGFLANFGEISSVAWIACISHSFVISFKISGFFKLKRMLLYYTLYSILFPLLLSLIPLFTQSYGFTGSWCWLNFSELNNYTIVISFIILFYFLANFIFQLVCTILVFKQLNRRYKEIYNDITKISEVKMIYQYRILIWAIPLIIIISKFPSCLNRGIQMLEVEKGGLEKAQAFLNGIFGFLMSLVYIFYFRQVWFTILCCFKEEQKSTIKTSKEVDDSPCNRPINKNLNFEEVIEDHHEGDYVYELGNGLSDPEDFNKKRNCNSAECINQGRKKDFVSSSSNIEKFEKPANHIITDFGKDDLSNSVQKDSINEDNDKRKSLTKKESFG